MASKCGCTYTFEKVDCTLNILCNGKLKWAIDLCTVAWSMLGNCAGLNIRDAYNPWVSIKIIQLDGYDTVEEMIAFLQECKTACKNSITITADDINLELPKEGFTSEVWKKNGELCNLTVCTVRNEDGTFTATYLEGSTVVNIADYEKCVPADQKPEYIKDCYFLTPEQIASGEPEKNLEPVVMEKWCNPDGTFFYLPEGLENTEENIITQEQILNYTKMANDPRDRGALIEASSVLPTPEPYKGELTLCVGDVDVDAIPTATGTTAVADFLAKLPELPEGVQYGVMTLKAQKIEGQKGLQVTCDSTGEVQPVPESANTLGNYTTPYDATNEVLPSGETGIVGHALKMFEFIGEDADGNPVCKPVYDIACMLTDGDVLLNNGSPSGAFGVTLCFACFAAEPFDEGKAYAEGESAAEGGVNYIASEATVAGESPTLAPTKWVAVARIGANVKETK